MIIKKVKVFQIPGNGSHHRHEDGGGVELTLEDGSLVKFSFNVGDEFSRTTSSAEPNATPINLMSDHDFKKLLCDSE